MADYTQILARAVAMLDPNTLEQRKALYDRARKVLVDKLRGSDPTLSNTDLAAETAALESVDPPGRSRCGASLARPEPGPTSRLPQNIRTCRR